MVKHIVLWRLKDADDKAGTALHIKYLLEELRCKIPSISKLEVGIDVNSADNCSDVALYSEFATWQDLEDYIKHPLHVEASKFIRNVVAERRCADYSVE